MQIMTGFELAEKNKKLAAIQCIKLLGQKDPENVVLKQKGIYYHINKRGKKRILLPCISFNDYKKAEKKHPDARMMKCIGYYVLYWVEE